MSASRGFTLVELLVVIIIIAVLAAVAIPKMQSSKDSAKEANLAKNLKLIRHAVERFRVDTGHYPRTLEALERATAPAQINTDSVPSMVRGWPGGMAWNGPYLNKVPLDSMTGTPFAVSLTNSGSRLVVTIHSTSAAVGSNGIPYNQW